MPLAAPATSKRMTNGSCGLTLHFRCLAGSKGSDPPAVGGGRLLGRASHTAPSGGSGPLPV
eukprot:10394699-Alexandrium_andersonii.AAC.1